MSILDKFNLENDVAIITGGAGLLGRYHAEALLDMNCKVIITDINDGRLEEAKLFLEKYDSDLMRFKKLDVTNEDNIKAVRDEIIIEYGIAPTILINNAAIDTKVDKDINFNSSRLENFKLEQWNNELNIGLTGAFLCSKHFGSSMANNQKGVILNISSDLGIIAPNQNLYSQDHLSDDKQNVKPITYSVIKHGLIGLTKYLSTYWINNNVRCNALAPGGVLDNQSSEFINKVQNLIPMGRMAKLDEYQAAVLFLCSDASSYMNGAVLSIDGGRSAW
jgi:NAD(P)-dependent dehydrogenase (short-subunit alcohol dehydrogenase family)